MNIKEHFNNFKNSSIIQDAIVKLNPTCNAIKNGGYKIILISTLITMVFLPINAIIVFFSRIISKGSYLAELSLTSLIGEIFNGYTYLGTGSLIILIGLVAVSAIISLIAFVATTFIVSNANFRAFKILAEEDRVVSPSEYFKLAFTEIIPFAWKFFLNVILPLAVVNLAGAMINVIPYVRGISIANIIIAIATYALMFRFFAIMLNLEHEKVVVEFSAYWLTFAIVIYLARIATTLSLVVTVLEMAFTLYVMLLLTNKKQHSNDDVIVEAL